jgi:hypothetical protein
MFIHLLPQMLLNKRRKMMAYFIKYDYDAYVRTMKSMGLVRQARRVMNKNLSYAKIREY